MPVDEVPLFTSLSAPLNCNTANHFLPAGFSSLDFRSSFFSNLPFTTSLCTHFSSNRTADARGTSESNPQPSTPHRQFHFVSYSFKYHLFADDSQIFNSVSDFSLELKIWTSNGLLCVYIWTSKGIWNIQCMTCFLSPLPPSPQPVPIILRNDAAVQAKNWGVISLSTIFLTQIIYKSPLAIPLK